MTDCLKSPIPVQRVRPDWAERGGVTLDVLRLDQLHARISGNKWFKLKYHLENARVKGIDTVMSFGGAWSNHIHALAAAGRLSGFNTIGIIRGEHQELTPTLQDAKRWGMALHFVTRIDYRRRYELVFQNELVEKLGYRPSEVLVVPEGGGGGLGVKGCEEILSAGGVDPCSYHQIWLACGTGATLAGVARSVGLKSLMYGIAVLKGADFLRHDITSLVGNVSANWQLNTDSHCGGYGGTTPELLDFIAQFELDTGIPLDQVYTGKVMLALKKKIVEGRLSKGCRILMIHTGGLQGKRGIK